MKRASENPQVCSKTGKIPFSEAQANRRLGKYEDIVRYYFCDSCNGYHLTSQSEAETIGRHVLDPVEENKLLNLRLKQLQNEIRQLKRNYKILKNEKTNNSSEESRESK